MRIASMGYNFFVKKICFSHRSRNSNSDSENKQLAEELNKPVENLKSMKYIHPLRTAFGVMI